MRKKRYYIGKYGPVVGALIFKLLQKEAAHAKWKAHYTKKLDQCREQVKLLKMKDL
jgi:hypothetical protein